MTYNAQSVNADITALLRARHTLMWLVSREEMRVERALVNAAGAAKFEVRMWDCATGLSDANGKRITAANDPGAVLDYIRTNKARAVYVLRDLHKWLDPVVLRSVRSLARELQTAPPSEARALVVLTPSGDVPPELGDAVVIEYPLPDRAEVARILDDVLAALPDSIRVDADAELATPNGMRDRAVDAAVGLTGEEIANCYARSLVTSRKIDPALVSSEKRRVIAREKVLTWHDPDPRGLDAVGGLDVLKSWLAARRRAFSPAARAFGLPAPKGMMLVGIPGCLAAGTRISYKRGNRKSGAGRSLPIEVFFEKFNGASRVLGHGLAGAGAAWNSELPTYAQSWDAESGKIVYNEVLAVLDNGMRECLRIVLEGGDSVDLTSDHPVLTSKGTFIAAGDVGDDDRLLIRGSMKPSASGRARIYRKRTIVEGLKYHPHAHRKVVVDQDTGKQYEYGRIANARLVIEAQMNKITPDELIRVLKEDPERAERLAYLPSEYDVHHADEDPQNDALDNLVILTHEEHAAQHGDESHFNVEYTNTVRVISVQKLGVRHVYDVTMAEPQTNLCVNDGIIVHNCGKSLTAKAVAAAWQMPLLRLDMGALRSKYVGDSEANIRKALKVAEAVSPCILWIDEIEKALAGAGGPAGDGGVAADALGTVLSWMQEREGSVFVIATANDVRGLPPELLRKGRFDELFWVDLPTHTERVAIISAALRQHGRAPETINTEAVSIWCDGFTGAEIAALVPDALFAAFADGERPLCDDDLRAAAATVVPLARTASDKLTALREWAKGRARPASTPETSEVGQVRSLDLG